MASSQTRIRLIGLEVSKVADEHADVVVEREGRRWSCEAISYWPEDWARLEVGQEYDVEIWIEPLGGEEGRPTPDTETPLGFHDETSGSNTVVGRITSMEQVEDQPKFIRVEADVGFKLELGDFLASDISTFKEGDTLRLEAWVFIGFILP